MTRRIIKHWFIFSFRLHLLNLRFIFLLIVIPSCILGQTISRIEITGAKNFSANTYKQWIGIQEGSKSFSGIEDSVKLRINENLTSEGFYHSNLNAKIIIIDSISSNLKIEVHENEQTIIRSVKLSNSISDSVNVSKFISEAENKIFSTSILENMFDELLTYYENNGHPFAKIKIVSLYFEDDSTKAKYSVDVLLKIEEDVNQNIDKIEIEGNTKTEDYVVIRGARINTGTVYSQKAIDEIPDRLNRLRFFEPVEPPTFYNNSKKQGVLKIAVREKETNSFDGIAGYVPATNQNESGYFTGFVNINMRNLFGTGRTAMIRWQQETRYSQELELRYLEPWLFNFLFNVELGLLQRKQDSTYVQRSIDAKLEYLATEDISASLFVNSQSTIPTERKLNTFTVYNSSSLSTGFIFKLDTRDDYYSPTKGLLFISSYKFTKKNIDGPEQFLTQLTQTKFNQQRIEFDISGYKELFSRQVAAFGLHGRELRGSNLEISDLYLLGGANTLRGYREKQFPGNRIFWSNLEYRFLLSRRSFAFLFFDSGYYLRTEGSTIDLTEVSDFKIGYGFGLNIETGLGVLSVSFALGKGDSFTDGKIHFGIINEF